MDKNSQEKITIELNADEFKKLQKLLELDEKNEQDQQKKESEKKQISDQSVPEKEADIIISPCQN